MRFFIADYFHVDVDECEVSPCDQICNNTVGAFECSCNEGFRLDEDGRTCDGA